MRNTFKLTLLVALGWLSACASTRSAAPTEAQQDTTAPSQLTAPAARPRLVLALVLDQFPSDALRYLPYLDEDGLLRRMVAEGALVERARLSFSTTDTAPGHAAIHTGRPPAESGIDSNGIWNAAHGEEVPIVSQSESQVFGVEGKTAGPDVLLADTVGDMLRASSPDSVILSLSHKDRAAITSGGKTANLAAWYDSSLPGFTTSSAYVPELPSWISVFNVKRPVTSAFGTWSAETPELYQELFGNDAAPGEANWHGLGTIFPHEPGKSDNPEKAYLASPHSVDYLLDFAREAADVYDMGGDDIVDLLCLSVSTTDYAGHSFSPQSWEYLDVLRKADRALGVFVREMEERSGGKVSVILTSDHGAPRLPEAQGHGGRILHGDLVAVLDAAVDKKLGRGDWISAYVAPYLYLTPKARERHAEVLAVLADYAAHSDAVAGLFGADEARSWAHSSEPTKLAIANSIAPGRTDIYVLPAPGYFADPECSPDIGKGINHGTPEDSDREVPVFMMGATVEHGRVTRVVPQDGVAPSISRLLGVASPTEASVFSVLDD